VAGKVIPETENPVPLTVAELTVTDELPIEESVRVCVSGVFNTASPNEMFVALTLSVGTTAFNCNANDCETPPVAPISVTVCVVVTADTLAVNTAVTDPAGIVIDAGKTTAVLLLLKLTAIPPVGALDASVAVQVSLPSPIIDAFAHEIPLNGGPGIPAALAAIVIFPAEELLVITTLLVKLLTCGEVKVSVKAADCPGFNVKGSVTPDHANSDPLLEIPDTVAGAVPVEFSVTVCDALCPATTLPKFTVVVLTLKVGIAAFNCNANDSETPPVAPVIVAVCAVVTADTVAVNADVVAPAGTVTDAGTTTALLLLLNVTAEPPVGALEASVTVQESLPAPVIDPFAHKIELSAGATTPAALSLIVMLPADELLAIVTIPVNVLTCGDVKVKVSDADCPGFSVKGRVTPDHVNRDPTIEMFEMVTGPVPVELKASVCDAVCPATTLPKCTVVELALSVGVPLCALAIHPPQSKKRMQAAIDRQLTRFIFNPNLAHTPVLAQSVFISISPQKSRATIGLNGLEVFPFGDSSIGSIYGGFTEGLPRRTTATVIAITKEF
jgi:hypothetical protein